MDANKILKLIDSLIPEDKKASLEENDLFRSRVMVATSLCCGVILLSLPLTPVDLPDEMNYFVVIASLCFGIALLGFRFFKFSFNAFAICVLAGGIVPSAGAAFVENVYFTSTFNWFTVLPLLAVFMVGIKMGLAFTLVLLAINLSVHFGSVDRGLMVPEIWSTPENFAMSTLRNQVTTIIASFAASAAFEFLRARGENHLRESNAVVNAQQDRMRRRDRSTEMAQIAGGFSHEINNPLMIIKLSAEVLIRKGESGTDLSPERVVAIAKKVNESCDRVAAIVEAFSVFQAREISSRFGRIYLKDFLAEVKKGFQELEHLDGVYLSVVRTPSLNDLIGNADQIKTVIFNLVQNSLDSLHWSTDLREKWVEVNVDVNGDGKIFFSIEDSGPGVSEENEKSAFQPFYTTKPIGKGIGLGLSIAQEIVHNHNGDICIERANGKQSICFTIEVEDRNLAA